MKAGSLAVAAAMAMGVAAQPGKHHAARRHAHEAFHERGMYLTAGTAPAAESTCGCTTIYSTFTGEGTLYHAGPAPTTYAANTTSIAPSTTSKVVPTTYPAPIVPTPLATTCPTPGVYTVSATTLTLTVPTTVCAATSTHVPSGTHTAGGVTTVVTTATTVVCPYATVSTSEGTVTSTILTTTYVCPSAGTYTIAPLTTTVSKSTVWVYPTAASYAPGTYTQAEVVTTVTETDYVVVCPFTSPAPPAPKPTTKAAAPVVPTYAPAPPPAQTYAPAPKPVETVKAAPPPPKAATYPTSGGVGNSGNKWAITYTPYNDDGSCKNAFSVAADIAMISLAGFKSIRTYSTDCSGLQNIGANCELHGLKMILGVFISDTGCSGAAPQIKDITNWGKWNLVDMIVIGNEAIFSGHTTGSELAGFIGSAKSAFAGAGYTGMVTTTEPLNVWQENTDALCGAVDITGCNIHPFFNADVDAASAGPFVASQLAIVEKLCPGKAGVNLETGWPSSGSCNGKACPGSYEQGVALKSITAAAGGKSVMFSFTNDLWKKDLGAFGCEQSWGAIHAYLN